MQKLEILAMTYQPAVLSCVKIVQEKVGRVSVSSCVSRCSGPVPSCAAEVKEYGAVFLVAWSLEKEVTGRDLGVLVCGRATSSFRLPWPCWSQA